MAGKGHNYGKCRKCGRFHKPTKGSLGKHWKLTGQALKNNQEGHKKQRLKLVGKTLEEIMGKEKADVLRRKQKEVWKKRKKNGWISPIKGKPKSKKHKEKLSEAFLGKSYEQILGGKEKANEKKRNQSKAMKEKRKNGYIHPNIRKTYEEIMGKEKADATRNKQSKTQKNLWQNLNYAKMMIKSWHKKPNGFEIDVKTLLDIIVSNQYIYTGNKIRPDFTNKKDKTKIILAHGLYWHLWKIQKDRNDFTLTKNDIEKRDIKSYKKAGYKDILIIWEDEFYEKINKVVKQIEEFTKGGNND